LPRKKIATITRITFTTLRTEKTFYIITPDDAKERYSEVEQRVAASHTQ
jgi:hypothetical protein